MKVRDFLKDHILFISLTLFLCLLEELFFILFDVTLFLKFFIPIATLLIMITVLVSEIFKKKSFYNQLILKLESLDQKYIINELLETPNFLEGQILKEVLDQTGKAMIDHVNQYKFNMQEYREYIEMWVHEVKTPIATSKMIIENNQNETTKSMEEEIDKIDQFVEQALYYARSNHVEKDYAIRKCNLKSIVNQVIRKNKKELLRYQIKIELKELEKEIYTDSKWMEFILNQIIVNSIKYRTQEQPKIEIYARNYKDGISIYIKDNGIGISKKEIGKVFEKGFTGQNGRQNAKATGMGLYLCKKLCDKLGHGIDLISRKDKGTEIRISFPKNSMTEIS